MRERKKRESLRLEGALEAFRVAFPPKRPAGVLSSKHSSQSLELQIVLIKFLIQNCAVVNQGPSPCVYFVADETFFTPVSTATKFKVLCWQAGKSRAMKIRPA